MQASWLRDMLVLEAFRRFKQFKHYALYMFDII